MKPRVRQRTVSPGGIAGGLAIGVLLVAATPVRAQVPALIPGPAEVVREEQEHVPIPAVLRCQVHDPALRPLVDVMDYEYRMLGLGRVEETTSGANCELWIDRTLAADGYRLHSAPVVRLSGGSYKGVAFASVTFMQLAASVDDGRVPVVQIVDAPGSSYRGLLVDPARQWHEVEILEQVVRLCRWYKIDHLQLHLTDDQLFTFPTETLPALPSPGFHYSKDELRALDEFARRHGVTLVPEIEMPGHAGNFVRRMPELFGIRDWELNPNSLNMGKEAVYAALDTLLGEVADVFRTSPFIHMGGDEAGFHHHEDDPDVQAYMQAHHLDDIQDLYRHFINRINDSVRRRGRQMILWEGFAREGSVEIPRNVVVMAWETIYQLPEHLLEDGYSIINVSWQPLYVVNERKWSPRYIYEVWNPWRWENWVPWMPSFTPIQLDSTLRVVGASMASWDQAQEIELFTLRKRLGAFGQRAWTMSRKPLRPWPAFASDLDRLDAALSRILTPLQVSMDGIRYSDLEEGQWNEHTWFGDTLTIRVGAPDSLSVHYTLDGSPPGPASARYALPLRLDSTAHVRLRAFSAAGRAVGHEWWQRMSLRPIHARVAGDLVVPMDSLWTTLDSWRAEFRDGVTVTLTSLAPGTIHYTTDDSPPTPDDPAYQGPIFLDDTTILRAQLFHRRVPRGEPWIQHFALKIDN